MEIFVLKLFIVAQGQEKETYPRGSGLGKGAIEPVRDQNRGFYSNLLLEKKTDSGIGPLINLRGLNCYIKKRTFRISTIKDVSQRVFADETGPPQ